MENKREIQLMEIVDWAASSEAIRAVLLTSSLVNPYAPVDPFSDLDIEFVVSDIQQFLSDDTWVENFGKKIAMIVENEDAFEGRHAMRMVFYEDYTKVDFKIYSVEKFLEDVAADELQEDWDVGYVVLLDKDGLTKNMKPPTYEAVMIHKPTEQEFATLFNDFWWDMTYVAKCLWRGDLFYAKFMSEDNMRTQYFTTIIEWHIGLEHDWKVSTNKKGRLFKKYLPSALWKKIEATFSGSDIEDNWRALFAYADIGSELGIEMAKKLGYPYPIELEQNIRTYLEHVRTMKKKEEL
ncbi:aminoglycoside 6-adenylyltransferase [Flavobacterium endophyticum]|uniref:Aminoglycoside 6-adenylyltransferase n=1 Tax=Flavobacterium endophyticum TaxID=1540163 RepID=A0A495MIS9_9FLAO|nr:AadS family aminoglycoside 6-adenylyltransferase [Flavobacterium endophyticum]RKS25310.1 aminoglycoside 6-adenylyltransferase [Flavobacterium endophyticum]